MGLYLVNCFDTFHAAKTLKYPALSLAHLLKYYGNIKLNKKHQLSDWRQRPLPQEMIDYARSDTCYLHFLYDSMRRDIYKIHGKEGLQAVLNASRKWCFKRYEKDPFWPLGYRKLLSSEGCPPGGGGTGTGGGKQKNNNNNANTANNANNSSNSNNSNSGKSSSSTLTDEQDLVLAGKLPLLPLPRLIPFLVLSPVSSYSLPPRIPFLLLSLS